MQRIPDGQWLCFSGLCKIRSSRLLLVLHEGVAPSSFVLEIHLFSFILAQGAFTCNVYVCSSHLLLYPRLWRRVPWIQLLCPSVRPSVHPPVTSFFGIGIFSQIFCMKLGFNKHARLVDPIFLREILVMPKMGVN